MCEFIVLLTFADTIFFLFGGSILLGKDMKIEEQNAQYVQEFLDNEIIRLGELIEEYKANVKVMGEDFNMDNPNGGMYSGMELTEIHH